MGGGGGERQRDRPWEGGAEQERGGTVGTMAAVISRDYASTEEVHDLSCWMYLRAPFSLSPASMRCAAAHVQLR